MPLKSVPKSSCGTTQREFLDIICSVLLLRPYLEGTQFIIQTDHESLWWILDLADATEKLARRRLRLSELNYDVVHRAEVKHWAASAL